MQCAAEIVTVFLESRLQALSYVVAGDVYHLKCTEARVDLPTAGRAGRD